MKMKKISTKLIKPQTPTPQDLKNYKISFIDQHVGTMNVAVILFYQSKPQEITQLEKSLAGILADFYPLAGRYIKNENSVDCSDQGAEFVEADALDVAVELIDFVRKIENHHLNDLLPDQYFLLDEAAANPLLSIKATHFPCGGLTIAVSVSHRIFDGSSLGTFIAAWSDFSHQGKTVVISPAFHLPSLLPCKDHDPGDVDLDKFQVKEDDCTIVKRLILDARALNNLRSKNKVKTISRVLLVSAVIAKALIGVDRSKHGRYRDFVFLQPVNLRGRTIPPQPKHACGNLFIPSLTWRVAAAEVEGLKLDELVDLIGDAVEKTVADHAEILSPSRDGRDVIITTYENLKNEMWNSDTNVVVCGDQSKFGFYEANFGWGKPILAAVVPQRGPMSTAVLVGNKEGNGIEAWLRLKQSDVPYLEQDEDVKLYIV